MRLGFREPGTPLEVKSKVAVSPKFFIWNETVLRVPAQKDTWSAKGVITAFAGSVNEQDWISKPANARALFARTE